MPDDLIISQLELIQQLAVKALSTLQKDKKPGKKKAGCSDQVKVNAILKRERTIKK